MNEPLPTSPGHRPGPIARTLLAWLFAFVLFAVGATSASAEYELDTTWGGYGTACGEFNGPWGIAVSPYGSGHVYVADSSNNRIEAFYPQGQTDFCWGQQGGEPQDIDFPKGVATDSTGRVYVQEAGFQRIKVFDAKGNPVEQWKSGSGDGEDVAIEPHAGRYAYVATGSSVESYYLLSEQPGEQLTKWSLGGQAKGIAVDASGTVYVATSANRIERYTSAGGVLGTTGDGQLADPHGVAVDADGNIFVASTGESKIKEFNPGGALVDSWSFAGQPWDVAVDDDGNVYVTDASNNGVQKFAYVPPPADTDADGVIDDEDNCPRDYNPDQADWDGNGTGDACDPPGDTDGDGVTDNIDNCPIGYYNPDQADNDRDGAGDACDSDDDNDGVADDKDNCDFTANPDQANLDNDRGGDACDSDDDNDGVADSSDNCPTTRSSAQTDSDRDGRGDACDSDDDNDGVADANDNCKVVANPDQRNADGDIMGDACDSDDDNDGVADDKDNCHFVPNGDQADNDADGKGNACDPLPSITSLTASPREMPIGSATKGKGSIRFAVALSENASQIVLTVGKRFVGQMVGGRCAKRPAAARRRNACTRYRSIGALSKANVAAGQVEFVLTRQLNRKLMTPDVYRATATATDAMGRNSESRSVRFRVVDKARS